MSGVHSLNLHFLSKISCKVPPFFPGSAHFLEGFLYPLAPLPPFSFEPFVFWGSGHSHTPVLGCGLQNVMDDLRISKPSAASACIRGRGHFQAWGPASPGCWLASCNGIRAGHARPLHVTQTSPSLCILFRMQLSILPSQPASLSWPVQCLATLAGSPFPPLSWPLSLSLRCEQCSWCYCCTKPLTLAALTRFSQRPDSKSVFWNLGVLSEIPRSYRQFSDYVLRFQSSLLEFSQSWSPFSEFVNSRIPGFYDTGLRPLQLYSRIWLLYYTGVCGSRNEACGHQPG